MKWVTNDLKTNLINVNLIYDDANTSNVYNIYYPDICFLSLNLTINNVVLAKSFIPVVCIEEGIKCIPLLDINGNLKKGSVILAKVTFE